MSGIILFNKPFQVLSQFTDTDGRHTLADYLDAPGFRAAGRLDYDSEGLLLLTDDGRLQQQIADPQYKLWKTYLVQVEGTITQEALTKLQAGVVLKDGPTLPAKARGVATPQLWQRSPPVRARKTVSDSWLELSIQEGRNRQIRRMTAAVGFPTLRLVRKAIGQWRLDDIAPGAFRRETAHPATPQRTSKRNRRT